MNIKNITIFLDMDGVLANFDGSIAADNHLNSMRTSLRSLTNNLMKKINIPDEFLTKKGLHFKDVESCLRGPQTDPDLHRLKQKLKFTKERIFEYASQEGFFLGLDKMPDADELFEGVEALGIVPDILTAPLLSSPTCREEKKLWIEKHYGGRFNNFFCETHKDKYANSNKHSILIDDTPKKIRAFNKEGGIGILHYNAKETLEELNEILKNIH